MTIEQTDEFDLNKPLRVLFQRKWLILSCLIGVLSSIIFLNYRTIPIYKADTTIIFEEQRGTAASINPFKISLTKRFITNQIEEIKSRSLSEEVYNALPISIINTFPLPQKPKPDFNKDEYITRKIQKNMSASSVTNSEVIKIEVEAYSPISAKIIANMVAEVLKRRNLEVRREETSNVREIIEEQLVTFKKQLDDAEIGLKNFKELSQVTVIDKEAEEIFKRITEAEIVYNQAKTNLDAAQKRYAFIQDKLAQERKDLIPTITKITSPWAQKLKEQLVELEVQYTTLKVQDYSDDHPKMLKLKQQIDETKENLKKESLKIAAGENIVDPISQIQKFMEESIALEIEIQTYRAQEHALKEVIEDYKRNLNTLPDKELRLVQLMRDKEVNEKIYLMLLQKREEAKIAEAERIGNIRIIDPAQVPTNPVKPRKKLNLLLGLILGSVMGIGLAFVLEYLDNSVKTVEEAEQISELSVLGTIPQIKTTIKNTTVKNLKKQGQRRTSEMISKLITAQNLKSPESEAFRSLRTNLQFTAIDSPLTTILITSSNPNEGKSLITANLSITTAQMGLKTLLVDADLRKPILHTLLQIKSEPGLIDIITATRDLTYKTNIGVVEDQDVSDGFDIVDQYKSDHTKIKLQHIQQVVNLKNAMEHNDVELINSAIRNFVTPTHIDNLDILPCGRIPPNPSEILASRAMSIIFHELKKLYDAIFIDTPPINVVTDAGILGSIVDGSILVIKSGSSTTKDIQRAKSLLKKAQAKMLGLVVNFIDKQNGYSNYYDYYFSDNNDEKKIKKYRIKHEVY